MARIEQPMVVEGFSIAGEDGLHLQVGDSPANTTDVMLCIGRVGGPIWVSLSAREARRLAEILNYEAGEVEWRTRHA